MPPINKSRIAKNTALLYFRMMLIMLITLYTARVALNVLGAEDFGTYEAVAGVVLLFAFLSSTMANAAQRFFAMELGVENHSKLKQIFSINIIIFIGLALIVLILAETVGLWFLKVKMVIPPDRMNAALWVYQFSIITIMANIITIPYLAIITAREQMNVYAWLSILEVVFKLGILFVLIYVNMDKLILYAILFLVVQVLITSTYITYSTNKFSECKVKYYWDKKIFKEIFGFAGWNVMGSLAMTARSQGVVMLLNTSFGVLANAAYGIAYKVYYSLFRFADGFFTAVRPQIIKSYSYDNEDKSGEMMKLVFQSSKFCFYLILVLAIPTLIETKFILELWLKKIVPDSTLIFTRLMIITALIESLANPLITSINATGKIRKYQIFTSSIILLILPVSYLFLKLGYPPQTIMYVMIVTSVLAQVGRIYFMKNMLKMNIIHYLKQVIFPVSMVTIGAFVLPIIYFYSFEASFLRLLGVCSTTVISSIFIIYSVGLTKSEKEGLVNFIFEKLKRKI
jgi:Na+-driven multidrug efflux pump